MFDPRAGGQKPQQRIQTRDKVKGKRGEEQRKRAAKFKDNSAENNKEKIIENCKGNRMEIRGRELSRSKAERKTPPEQGERAKNEVDKSAKHVM